MSRILYKNNMDDMHLILIFQEELIEVKKIAKSGSIDKS